VIQAIVGIVFGASAEVEVLQKWVVEEIQVCTPARVHKRSGGP
jgi:hypothetical protein